MAEEVKETIETVIEEPNEKLYSEKEWKGLLGDKQNETRARQEAQAEAANLRIQIAELRAQKASTVEDDTGDPEDVATLEAVDKKIAKLENKLTGMYTTAETAKEKAEREKFVEKSFEKSIKLHTEEKEGKGLSFDEVNGGTKRMIAENKKYRDLILNDENPGEKRKRQPGKRRDIPIPVLFGFILTFSYLLKERSIRP
jgi:hypothetical protein